MTLRVMAYNIHHGADAQGRVDLQRIAETILIYEPDILFLSEVDQYWRRSGLVDQPEYLAKATRMPYSHFAPALETRSPMVTVLGRSALLRQPHFIESAISKDGICQLAEEGKERAPQCPLGRCRSRRPPDPALRHPSERRFAERDVQLQALGELIAASPHPSLIVGDFNSPPERLKKEAPYLWISPWHDAHTAVGEGEGLTFPAPSPRSRIDYIFLHHDLLPWLTWAATPNSNASDHLPVIVELSISS